MGLLVCATFIIVSVIHSFNLSFQVKLVQFLNIPSLETCITDILRCNISSESSVPIKQALPFNFASQNDLFETVKLKLKDKEELCELIHEKEGNKSIEKLKLNLRSFLIKTDLHKSYSANVNFLIFSEEDYVAKQICLLENIIERHENPSLNRITCIHLVHNKNYLQQQQIDVAWQIVHSQLPVKQVHLISSKVSMDKCGEQVDIGKLLQMRISQIESAFKSKYGSKRAAFFTKETMEELAVASIKFEFMSVRSTLETKISTGGDGFDSRSGVFVFYNYARISSLLDKFEVAASLGQYPQLPELDEIDFHCLKLEEEWELLFNYLLEFSSVVEESVTRDIKGDVQSIVTHKICQFLTSFSNSFSKYYSRTHILVDPLPHLLPTMFARLYLVISIRQVFDNALSLLSIKPFQRL